MPLVAEDKSDINTKLAVKVDGSLSSFSMNLLNEVQHLVKGDFGVYLKY